MSSSLLFTLGVILLTYIGMVATRRILKKIANARNILPKRIFFVQKVFETLFIIIGLIVLTFVWGINIEGISVFASSVFAIVGVALFAQWSILSNVTASIIIFFTFPAGVGDRVRIVDGDGSVEGEILEIALFQIEIRDADGNKVLYPNNLLLQKPVIKLKQQA
ncbi:mechanosensitive ion channel family protein [bacterium]|nr:mechanosensitive ion channel family protein [bacterium]MBU1989847.1 mechanosensitive ion channel family protein [bacterium]